MAFVALSGLACGTGPSAVRPSHSPNAAARVTLAAPGSARALVAQDRIAVLGATQVPGSLQVDGQLTEWLAFAGGTPTPLTPSFVVVAAAADSVVLAGRVRNLPELGLWLRLETEASEFPPLGSLQRGGGISPLVCDAADEPGAPFDAETCHRLVHNYEDLQKSHAASFVRELHLTAQALTVRAGEREQALAGAKYAFRTAEGAATFEAVLPLSALPRMAVPELAGLLVAPQRAESRVPPEATAEVTQSVSFAEPIRFGMDSELLACLMQGTSAVFPTSPRFSYQPGVPNRIYRAQNVGGIDIQLDEVTLSNREASLGALEVRSVQGAWPLIAVIKEQTLLGCSSVGSLLGVVERGRGLHAIGYTLETDESVGRESANFNVLEIEKDGTLHNDLLETPETDFGYTSVGQAHAKDLASFSITGMYEPAEGGSQQHTLSWRYDKKLNRYALSRRKGRYVAPSSPE